MVTHPLMRRKALRRGIALLACCASAALAAPVVSPPQIALPPSSAVCTGGSVVQRACITLPPASVSDLIDVLFLIDDTTSTFLIPPELGADLVDALRTRYPGVDFGFGVARFEDYGDAGVEFARGELSDRPFILNQPIVTTATAGSATAQRELIREALARSSPGTGGDPPEAAIAEGLYQAATGLGFDGDGDGLTTSGGQRAGQLDTQLNPNQSGDVPAFSTLDTSVARSSGTEGGVGFRSAATKLIVLATDSCAVTAFAGPAIPTQVTGTGSVENVSDLACSDRVGGLRFGFVGNAKTFAANTVTDAVAPLGAGTVLQAIAALNALGIRVIGVGPGVEPTAPGAPRDPLEFFDPAPWLSSIARVTGAVAPDGTELVFDTGLDAEFLDEALDGAVTAGASVPLDLELVTSPLPAGLGASITPAVIPGVQPGAQACFDVTFSGTGRPNGAFDLRFRHPASQSELAEIPGEARCERPAALLLSPSDTLRIGRHLQIHNEDIARYDTETGVFSVFFDGSDVGLARENVDAFEQLEPNVLLLSFSDRTQLPGMGWVEDEDIVRFDASELGERTRGRFSRWLSGDRIGLRGASTDIDGLSVVGGDVFYSTQSTVFAGGQSFKNEDIVRYEPRSGRHSLWFDGSDVGLDFANLDAFEIQADERILMSFDSWVRLPEIGRVEDEDVVIFEPTRLGPQTAGRFRRFFDGDAAGLNGLQTDIDAVAREIGGRP